MISLENKIVTFTGPPDSGKSNLVKYMLTLSPYKSHLVYDPLFGFDPDIHNVVRPPDTSTRWRRYEDGNSKLNEAVDEFIFNQEPSKRPRYFVIDEAGRLLPEGKPEGPAMGELNDFNAHYGIGVWLIGQRFAQINTDFENKATHHFVMGYKGKNDKQALKDIHEDLPETLDETSEFGFAHVGPNGTLDKFKPVPEVGSKGKL
jgi:energy-coupling factor transporter ATP-binding protein EcfA2